MELEGALGKVLAVWWVLAFLLFFLSLLLWLFAVDFFSFSIEIVSSCLQKKSKRKWKRIF